MIKRVVVIGGKGTAVNIAEQIVDARNHRGGSLALLGFAIDDEALGGSINGHPVLCKTRAAGRLFAEEEVGFIFALYKSRCMAERVALLRSLGIPTERYATFVHPLAYVAPSASIGRGCVILAHASVQSGARVGNHAVVNSQAVVEHGAVVGDCNVIAASACIGSEVLTGEGVFVGINAAIRENTAVGDYAYIGMGSNVVGPVEPGSLVFGNPARRREKSW